MAALSPLKKFLKASPPPTASTSSAPIERLPTHLISEIGRQSPLRGILHLSRCVGLLFNNAFSKTNPTDSRVDYAPSSPPSFIQPSS